MVWSQKEGDWFLIVYNVEPHDSLGFDQRILAPNQPHLHPDGETVSDIDSIGVGTVDVMCLYVGIEDLSGEMTEDELFDVFEGEMKADGYESFDLSERDDGVSENA